MKDTAAGDIRATQGTFSSYAPNFEKVDGAYCFWSVHAWVGACVRGWVRGSHFLYLL